MNEKELSSGQYQGAHRIEWALSILIVLVSTWWVWSMFNAFNQDNHRYAQGICCGLIEPVLDSVQKIHRSTAIDFSKGNIGFIAAWWMEYWDRSPQSLLWLSQTAHILSGWLLFAFGCRWRAPLMGAVSSAAVLLTPVLLYTALRWDVYALQGPLVILAVIIGYGSRGFSSIPHCVVYAGIVWISAFWSSRETDNLILLLTEAAIAFGFWTSALWFKQDSSGRPISRIWSSIFGLATCAILIVYITQYWRFTSPEGIDYYFREAEEPIRNSTVQLTASLKWLVYWGHMYWRAFGPWVASMMVSAIVVGVFMRRLPLGLVMGIVIPYCALSVITKRNFYYPSTLWVLFPIVIGMPFYVSSWRWLRMLMASMVTMVLLWSANARLNGQTLAADETYGGIFQTSDGNLSLEPQRLWGVDALSASILKYLHIENCAEDLFVVLEANAMMEEVALRIAQQKPCMIVKRTLQMNNTDSVSSVQVWVTDSKKHPDRKQWLVRQGFIQQEDVLMDNRFYLSVWSR